MTEILIKVAGASIACTTNGKITSGMVGLPVVIEYDESWAGLTKTAFFRVGGQVRKRDSIGTSTTVPWEILRTHGKTLNIGIEGRDADGNIVLPTAWCVAGRVLEGADGEIPAAPNPDNGEHPSSGGAVIDDSQISASTTWSSQKISDEIDSNGGGGGSYELPIATPETLGGVQPTAKTEEMTQSVGVDEIGGLWTLPSGGGFGEEWELLGEYTITEDNPVVRIDLDLSNTDGYKAVVAYLDGVKSVSQPSMTLSLIINNKVCCDLDSNITSSANTTGAFYAFLLDEWFGFGVNGQYGNQKYAPKIKNYKAGTGADKATHISIRNQHGNYEFIASKIRIYGCK